MDNTYMVDLFDYMIDSAARILSYPDFRFIIMVGLSVFVISKIFDIFIPRKEV